MPTAASMTFGAGRVDPIKGPEDPRVENVNLQASLTLAAGTVLAELVGNDEVQTVTITGTPTGGTFTLTYSGQTTAAIAYNATAATVQTRLEALSNVGTGNVLVTGGPGPGTAWVVQFRNALGRTNVAQMTSTDSLTGGTTPASAVTTTTAGSAGTPGTYGPYSAAATNGLQWPIGILQYACTTDASGNVSPGTSTSGNEWGVTRKYTQMYVQGEFSCADLVGLDENALALPGFGRLVQGNVTSGRVLLLGS